MFKIDFNPVAFKIANFAVHWYGIMYLLSFISGWLLARYRLKKWQSIGCNYPFKIDQLDDLLFYIVLGVILGGRIGYIIFYNLHYYVTNPAEIFALWHGGMSFHGGLIGVILSCYLWTRKQKLNFFSITDFIAPIIPIGLAAGRIGNFINGELWGRVTNVPWAVIYPKVDLQLRHPSELYEFFLEGIILFIILWFFNCKNNRPKKATSAMFLLLYGCFRFICEFFRQPDIQLGIVFFGYLTRGQELCLIMIIIGLALLYYSYKNKIK